MNVRTYARFSPRPCAAECESIEQQTAQFDQFCKRQRWRVVDQYSDADRSGGDRNRAGLYDAVAACKRGETLLVYDWSRLGRDTLKQLLTFEELNRRGCRLHSVIEGVFDDSDDPTKKLLSVLLSAVAEYQREVGNRRTSGRMLRRQANGERMGAICPFGWEDDPDSERNERGRPKRMRLCAEEMAIVADIQQAYGSGAGLREIARSLNARGVNCRGRKWNHVTVSAIVTRGAAARG